MRHDLERRLAESKDRESILLLALRQIAFFVPTVCYEHADRRYVDIEDVYALKKIAAAARNETIPQ